MVAFCAALDEIGLKRFHAMTSPFLSGFLNSLIKKELSNTRRAFSSNENVLVSKLVEADVRLIPDETIFHRV